MAEQAIDIEELFTEINAVLKAAEAKDLDTIYDHRASIISMYAQAMAEFHFLESQLEWLNDILRTVEGNDIAQCREVLERESDTETLFLGSQFAALMAGCFHHDELMTVAQAIGLQALLTESQEDEPAGPVN
ncbi:hypothetical protein [Desulfogranum mediterraneum]|uniref:hypothetical protein n=1 Tax=Desulfogranum mediterraneum TaxID=160661 RepID=UPI000413FBD2|nr:hypothetical protein [Desulfogranum mediterraneum]